MSTLSFISQPALILEGHSSVMGDSSVSVKKFKLQSVVDSNLYGSTSTIDIGASRYVSMESYLETSTNILLTLDQGGTVRVPKDLSAPGTNVFHPAVYIYRLANTEAYPDSVLGASIYTSTDVYRTIDQGDTWSVCTCSAPSGILKVLGINNKLVVLSSGAQGIGRVSTDGGVSFTDVILPNSSGVAFANIYNSICYIQFNNLDIYTTKDFEVFTLLPITSAPNISFISLTRSGTYFIRATNGYLYTTDSTGQAVLKSTNFTSYTCIYRWDEDIVVISGSGQVGISRDLCTSWHASSTSTPSNAMAYDVNNPSNRLISGGWPQQYLGTYEPTEKRVVEVP